MEEKDENGNPQAIRVCKVTWGGGGGEGGG